MTDFPWNAPLQRSLEDRLEDLRRDVATMLTHTCAVVFSTHGELDGLRMNMPRGTVPRGKSTYRDGTTVEFIDAGMPQIGVPSGEIADLIKLVSDIAQEEGLEL